MVYSESQKKLLEYIASTNDKCVSSTVIRKIMEITDISAIEFEHSKKTVIFHTSITGDGMISQRLIQCLVILEQLEKDNQIFIEKDNYSDSIPKYFTINRDVQLKSKAKNEVKSDPEEIVYSFCQIFYNAQNPQPIQRCGIHKTNVYELVIKYAGAIIYPTPELIEFVENGFKTPEEFRFEKQLNIEREQHKKEMILTKCTLFIAIFIPLITCFMEVCSDSNTYLMNKDLKIELIDTIHTNVVYQQSFEKDTSKLMSSN